jgi:osmotically-inducible protein OsmY
MTLLNLGVARCATMMQVKLRRTAHAGVTDQHATRAAPTLRHVMAAHGLRPRLRSRRRVRAAGARENAMKDDLQLKDEVLSELAWDPAVHAEAIDVSVKDGMVALSGHLGTYAEKRAVEKAVRRVTGVRGVALDLDVILAPEHRRTDSDIARAVLAALQWHAWVPHQRLHVQVEDGWVTLSGEVDWQHQLASAEQCVRPLVGVRGITTRIAVKSRAAGASEEEVSRQIAGALTRHAQREANRIDIGVHGSVVTLEGSVDSLTEREAALGAAAATRGVSRVVDHLAIAG